MSQKLELPDDLYSALVTDAQKSGLTPVDWIAKKLPKSLRALTDEERRADDARLEQHTVSLGYPTGINNDGIDADLACEYGDDHKDLYRK